MPRVACRFYAQGRCNRGGACSFHHDPDSVQVSPPVCRYYSSGFCRAGESCAFRHENPPALTSETMTAELGLGTGYANARGYTDFLDDTGYTDDEEGYEMESWIEECIEAAQQQPWEHEDWDDPQGISAEQRVLEHVQSFPELLQGGATESAELNDDVSDELSLHHQASLGAFQVPQLLEQSINRLWQVPEDSESEESGSLYSSSMSDISSTSTEAATEAGEYEWTASYGRFSIVSESRPFVLPAGTWQQTESPGGSDVASENLDQGEDDRYRHDKWEACAVERGETAFDAKPLCQPWRENGACPNWRDCSNVHGHRCETCGKWCLHPYNDQEAKQHTELCSARVQRDQSRQITAGQECGICLEAIGDKPFSQQKFGLLSCQHCFCLGCMRDWRKQRDGETDQDSAIRRCPICRQRSDFVTPSKVWPRTPEEKAAIIEGYKARLATINCRYWMQSSQHDRKCPFGTSCFYHHPGQKRKTVRLFQTADGDVKFGNDVQLSDFLSNVHF